MRIQFRNGFARLLACPALPEATGVANELFGYTIGDALGQIQMIFHPIDQQIILGRTVAQQTVIDPNHPITGHDVTVFISPTQQLITLGKGWPMPSQKQFKVTRQQQMPVAILRRMAQRVLE